MPDAKNSETREDEAVASQDYPVAVSQLVGDWLRGLVQIAAVDKDAAHRSLDEALHGWTPPPPPIDPGAGGPHDPGMEPRVAALEADMKEVKASLKGLEVSSARIEAILGTLATKSDVEKNSGETRLVAEALHGLDKRVSLIETGSLSIANAAIGKNIGPWQLPAVLGASIVVGGAALAGAGYLLHLAGVLH